MKTIFLFVISTVFCRLVTSSQSTNNGIKNKYLTFVSATKEKQITGANSPYPNSLIYNITWKAKKNFALKKITGYIVNKDAKGKLIYNNTVSDSGSIKKETYFLIRFDINNIPLQTENIPDQKKPVTRKCQVDKKISSSESNGISLSFFIENKRANFRVKCTEKKMPADKQLPQ